MAIEDAQWVVTMHWQPFPTCAVVAIYMEEYDEKQG
jgi:hypothetical protein